jgi:hypothetical protein
MSAQGAVSNRWVQARAADIRAAKPQSENFWLTRRHEGHEEKETAELRSTKRGFPSAHLGLCDETILSGTGKGQRKTPGNMNHKDTETQSD